MQKLCDPLHRLFVGVLPALLCVTAALALPVASAVAATLEVFHADSLAGPMRALKAAFETAHPDVTIKLTSGVSRELAERILKGDACDVFASSSPAVIEQDLMGKKVAGTDREAAAWYVVFSANEMAVITAKGNPLGIGKIADLARPDIKFARVTGEKDLATNRTIEFLKRAAALEGSPDLAKTIVDRAAVDPPSRRECPMSWAQCATDVRTRQSSTTRPPWRRATTSMSCAFPTQST
jgi:ABC-type molybdate transport system substrate-binding protein